MKYCDVCDAAIADDDGPSLDAAAIRRAVRRDDLEDALWQIERSDLDLAEFCEYVRKRVAASQQESRG